LRQLRERGLALRRRIYGGKVGPDPRYALGRKRYAAWIALFDRVAKEAGIKPQ